MNSEDRIKTIDFIKHVLAPGFSLFPEIEAVYVFGSFAEGISCERSDIDIAVLLANSVEKDQYLDYRLDIIEEIQKRITRKVDVIILNQAPILLRFQALKKGKLIFERNANRRAEFQARSMARYYDYKRYFDFHNRNLMKRIKEVGLGAGYRGNRSALEEARQIHEKIAVISKC